MMYSQSLVRLLAVMAVSRGVASGASDASQKKLSDYECAHPPYKMHLLSKSPLVIYIEDFVTKEERLHLQEIAQGHFKHSAVLKGGNSAIHSVRTSQSTTVDRDAVVQCIEARALDFQGFDVPESHLEPIQLVKYAVTERYHFHTDWFTNPSHTTASLGGNRVSSFFGYVKADNVTGGGTNFPILDAPRDERWCRFIDCDEEYESGVTFRPIEGNGVYWENLLADGKGDQRTLHAGLPVVSGEKIGMNIWTRQMPLPADVRGN
ncbi:hypothetical protein V8C42DRAFT_172973 [Trichoderma barbatum]